MFAKVCALAGMLAVSGCADGSSLGELKDVSLRLEMQNGLCSGTAVGKDLILTAEHCFGGGRLTKINGHPAHALEMVKDGNDHVIVRVSVTFKRWAQMGAPPQQGERVRWIGNPGGEADVYREGYVSRVSKEGTLIVASGWKGDSGAGVVDSNGRVIGVVSLLYAISASMHCMVALPITFTLKQWREIRQ